MWHKEKHSEEMIAKSHIRLNSSFTKNLHRALGIYNSDDEKAAAKDLLEFETYFSAIEKEIPELELRYTKIIQRFEEEGIGKIKDFLEQRTDSEMEKQICEKVVIVAKSIKFRTELDALLRLFFDIFDLLFNEPETRSKYYVPAKRLAYLVALIRWHYKDPTLDLKWASEKVRRLLDRYHRVCCHTNSITFLPNEFCRRIVIIKGS